jgi:hypothetical protein
MEPTPPEFEKSDVEDPVLAYCVVIRYVGWENPGRKVESVSRANQSSVFAPRRYSSKKLLEIHRFQGHRSAVESHSLKRACFSTKRTSKLA